MRMTSAPYEVIFHRVDQGEAVLWVSCLGKRAGIADLQGKNGYLMVSVKNPSFSGRIINTYCDLVARHFGRGEVILVDTPYASTISAIEDDETVRGQKLANLNRLADEKRRFIERILAKRALCLPVRSFDQVARAISPSLLYEVRSAFEREGRFRRAILKRTREVVPAIIPDTLLPRFAEFLVSEIPVLCFLYYGHGEPGVVDVYPGENLQIIWDIERGLYVDELPGISRLAERSPRLIYVDIRL
ncbi:MAG: hypothetical protein WAK55_18770 [Xanthobacteraceae bacterium]